MTQAATLPAVATTLICSLTAPALALDNGLAETPPMGWNTFNCWHGNYDAEMIKDVADAFVASGLKDVGYNYVNIDGGWNRAGGTWLPEESKFPAGIAPVADHVHEQGLMLGIYCDTAQGQEQEVAERFATWGCDFLKHDDWTTSLDNPTWETMRDALAATDRPILYSIHTGGNDGRPEVANMWRTSGDIGNTWESVMDCIGTYTDGGGAPGAWPDPDMLQVGQHIPDGSPVLNFDEQKTHFSLWCVTSSPLILGNDVRAMFDETRSIVLNTEAIAVNQDISFAELEDNPFGSGKRVRESDGMQLWVKPLADGARAVLLVNTGESDQELSVSWSEAGLPEGEAQVRDLWAHENLGGFTNRYAAQVPPHGCKFLKIVPGSEPIPEPEPTWFPAPEAPTPIEPLARDGWSIESNLGNPEVYLDGDISTPVMASGGGAENVLTIDMQQPQTFNTVLLDSPVAEVGDALKPYGAFAPAQQFHVYVSEDGQTWGEPIYAGFVGPDNYAAATFPEQTARHLRVVVRISDERREMGWSDRYGAFGGEDGQQTTEIRVGHAEQLPAWTQRQRTP